MSDLNDIFGYKVYKPPPEKNLPMIADLNVYGEVVTLIDPNADVIKDPAVQRIFKSLDGERTVKIEDLPPDVRYDGWNKKAQYDKQIIVNNSGNRSNLQPQLPYVNQNLLRENENSHEYHQEALRQAQLKAMSAKNTELEFSRQLQETRIALEKEISKQLIEQLTIRAQKQSVTPEQQALIEKLYLDLRLINPDLAFGILKTFSNIENSSTPSTISSPAPSSIKQPSSRMSSVVQQQQQMTCTSSGGCPYAVSSRAVPSLSSQTARGAMQAVAAAAPVPQPRAYHHVSSSKQPIHQLQPPSRQTLDDVRAARIRASRR